MKSKFILFAFFFLFIFGCSKPNAKIPNNPHQLTQSQIVDFIERTNNITPFMGKVLADSVYSLPTREWISTTYSTSLDKFFFSLGNLKWAEDSHDCDNFAVGGLFWAQQLHASMYAKTGKSGLAVGEFWYTRDDLVNHAINIFIIFEDNQYKLVFYDPQLFKIVQLSDVEQFNALYYRF
jgi:hypothetical protein